MRRSALFLLVLVLCPSVSRLNAAPIVAGYERFGRHAADDAARVEAGLLLVGELGCVHCHAAASPTLGHGSPKPAPVLDTVGRRLDPIWLAAYLTDPRGVHPGTTMPDLLAGLPADRRSRTTTALVHFLTSTGPFAAGAFPGSEKAKADDERRHVVAALVDSLTDGPASSPAFALDPALVTKGGRAAGRRHPGRRRGASSRRGGARRVVRSHAGRTRR